MELLSVIRRWRYRQHFSIREIARRSGLSRNTVRRYLRADSVAPKFNTPERPSRLDPFADKLAHLLRQEAAKSRKHKRTARQLYADLVALGYDGSYNRVAAFVREWKAARHRELETCGRGAFVPLAFLAGEAFQFDWSEDWALLAGERVKLQVAHIKLCYSRAFLLRAYFQQTHEMLFDAHNHAFRVLGGVPRRGIYDNMRTAVDKVGRGKERKVNTRFAAMVSHFLFEAEFCNPVAGWEKGQIEKNVQDARVFARSHDRKGTTVYDWRHYLAVIQRKPGALRNGAPFAEMPAAFHALQQRMLKTPGGDREMVEILALVLQHDEQAVLTAVELALETGAPTKTHILNLLHRLVDGKPAGAPPVKTPDALTLTTEPQANLERYDALRKARETRHAS